MDGANIGPYLPPSIPIPGMAKVPCQGDEQVENKHIFIVFYDYIKECWKKTRNLSHNG